MTGFIDATDLETLLEVALPQPMMGQYGLEPLARALQPVERKSNWPRNTRQVANRFQRPQFACDSVRPSAYKLAPDNLRPLTAASASG